MAIIDSLDDLVDEAFDLFHREGFLVLPEVFLEVVLDVLEDQVQTSVCVNHFSQPENIVRTV